MVDSKSSTTTDMMDTDLIDKLTLNNNSNNENDNENKNYDNENDGYGSEEMDDFASEIEFREQLARRQQQQQQHQHQQHQNQDHQRQGPPRRCSVFSKSYDPDDTSLNEKFERDVVACVETIQNRPFETSGPSKKSPKTPNEISEMSRLLKPIILFKFLCDEDLRMVIESMFERECAEHEVIIREAGPGNYFYVILRGRFEVFKSSSNSNSTTKETICNGSRDSSNSSSTSEESTLTATAVAANYGQRIAEFGDKGYFGELALLYNQPRSATVVCKSSDGGTLLCMNRDIFQRLIKTSQHKRRKKYEEFLASVPLLKESMSEQQRGELASSLSSRTYARGELIFKQEDEACGIYFVESGQVRIVQEQQEGDESTNSTSESELESLKSRELCRLECGEFFGEMALVNKAPRSASAYASVEESSSSSGSGEIEPCKLAFLDIRAFERLMGPCIELLKDRIQSYEATV